NNYTTPPRSCSHTMLLIETQHCGLRNNRNAIFQKSSVNSHEPSFPTRRSSDLENLIFRLAQFLPRLALLQPSHGVSRIAHESRLDRKSKRLNSSHDWN